MYTYIGCSIKHGYIENNEVVFYQFKYILYIIIKYGYIDCRNISVIMKRMCPFGYHHNGFVATHAFGT